MDIENVDMYNHLNNTLTNTIDNLQYCMNNNTIQDIKNTECIESMKKLVDVLNKLIGVPTLTLTHTPTSTSTLIPNISYVEPKNIKTLPSRSNNIKNSTSRSNIVKNSISRSNIRSNIRSNSKSNIRSNSKSNSGSNSESNSGSNSRSNIRSNSRSNIRSNSRSNIRSNSRSNIGKSISRSSSRVNINKSQFDTLPDSNNNRSNNNRSNNNRSNNNRNNNNNNKPNNKRFNIGTNITNTANIISNNDKNKKSRVPIVIRRNNIQTFNMVKNNSNNDFIESDTMTFMTNKNSWYSLNVVISHGTEYKSGKIDILSLGKLVPTIKLPNIIFTNKETVSDIQELFNMNVFNIYFKTDDSDKIIIKTENLSIKSINLNIYDSRDVEKKVNIWLLRKLYDLEFLNYYINNLETYSPNKLFIDRFISEFTLFNNPNYFEKFINKLNINNKNNIIKIRSRSNTKDILYLTSSSLPFEHTDDTVFTQDLLNSINDHEYNVYATTKYGYPYDLPNYMDSFNSNNNINKIDNVTYIRLQNKNDNFNTNCIIEYLEKYIMEIIKLSLKMDIKIIHTTSNFFNGVAGMYAAKYLGIKCIYEVREFWDEITMLNKPELYKSDLLNLKYNMEKLVMNQVDTILAPNEYVKNIIVDKNIAQNKIQTIYGSFITKDNNMEIYLPNNLNKIKLLNKFNLLDYDCIIGYICSSNNKYEEDLWLLIDCVHNIDNQNNQNNESIKFKIVIEHSNLSQELQDHIRQLGMNENILHIKNSDDADKLIYYDIFSIVLYSNRNINKNHNLLYKIACKQIPIITSDLCLLDNLFKCSEFLTYKNKDIDDLKYKLLELYKNTELRDNIINYYSNFISNNISWEIASMKLKELYDKLYLL
jgi:glycosyltransferase involved in cell wall biosynthesis